MMRHLGIIGTCQFASSASLASRDRLAEELFAGVVHQPTGHVDGLALMDGDDDVRIKSPSMFAVVFAGAGGGVGG
jgi:hypothetical protein